MSGQSIEHKEVNYHNIAIDSLVTNSRLTAIGGKASPSTVKFYEKFCRYKDREKTMVLDYGCGRKRNGMYFKNKGFKEVAFYDMSPVDVEVRNTLVRGKKYDIILLNYVLNVVPLVTRKEIMEKITEVSYNDSLILVEVRGISQVEYARKKSPNRWMFDERLDGYLVTRTKNGHKVYIQKGYEKGELEEFLKGLGFVIAHKFCSTKEKTSVVVQMKK